MGCINSVHNKQTVQNHIYITSEHSELDQSEVICSSDSLDIPLIRSQIIDANYREIHNMMYTQENPNSTSVNGIMNLNNTCFISSALQCILRIQPLRDYFLNSIHQKDIKMNATTFEKEFVKATANIFVIYHQYSHKKINIEKFIHLIPQIFRNYEIGNQEDVQEFLGLFFQTLNLLLNRNKAPMALLSLK